MKLIIESTTKVVELEPYFDLEAGGGKTIQARIWEGHTESGIPVHCFITRVAVSKDIADVSQFDAELREQRAPSAVIAETYGPDGIPLRLIL